jgi:phage terminase small subunit
MTRPLTPKQEAFCREYLIDLNGTQAAIRAGYSQRTANEQAARLLAKVSVSSHIQKLMGERAERVQRTADDVLKDIHKVKDSCMSEAFDQQGNAVMVDPKAALKALELEGRHLKMFTDKLEVEVRDSLAERLERVRAKRSQKPNN